MSAALMGLVINSLVVPAQTIFKGQIAPNGLDSHIMEIIVMCITMEIEH
jgi:hypothetical protein